MYVLGNATASKPTLGLWIETLNTFVKLPHCTSPWFLLIYRKVGTFSLFVKLKAEVCFVVRNASNLIVLMDEGVVARRMLYCSVAGPSFPAFQSATHALSVERCLPASLKYFQECFQNLLCSFAFVLIWLQFIAVDMVQSLWDWSHAKLSWSGFNRLSTCRHSCCVHI